MVLQIVKILIQLHSTLLVKKRVSTAQFVPRTSKEMQKHSYKYQILHEGLEPVFKWVESVVFYLFIFTIISMLNLSF